MNQKLAELFQQTIHKTLQLNKKGRDWSLNEEPQITMKAPSQHSLGFSLDCNPGPFASLFNAIPPLGIAKMCDAIIVLSYKNKDYIFVIEQKTRYKDGYKKQLANGKYFCDWLLALLKEHNHYNGKVVFIGLLCWLPREKSLRKGETRHGNYVEKQNNETQCDLLFEIRNEAHIYLQKIIK